MGHPASAAGLPVQGWLAQLPIAGEYLDRWWQTNLSNPKAMVEWLRGINIESITAWTSALGGALLHRLFLFLVTMIALFLVLRDGAWLAGRVLATTDLLLGGPGERLASKLQTPSAVPCEEQWRLPSRTASSSAWHTLWPVCRSHCCSRY